jgi:hypothetical protein
MIISFKDELGNRFTIKYEMVRYIAFVGNWGESSGQISKHIKPKNIYQQLLIDAWNKYHLEKPIDKFTEYILWLKNQIEELDFEEEVDWDNIPQSKLEEIEDIFFDVDIDYVIAIAKLFDLSYESLLNVEINLPNIKVEGVNYLFGTDDEMNRVWEKKLYDFIDHNILLEIPEPYRFYFDSEKWISDAKMDGRVHTLSSCDGNELVIEHNETYYYAYRN